ncbi:MAG: hypothetical protein KDB79_03965 [Acidobacteria bacterium]|nr:hypothetical protein [Acidobacteriota bacterium]
MIFRKILLLFVILFGAIGLTSCGIVEMISESTRGLVGLSETGTIISKDVYIRSSYAVVAADLLEVKRGETVEILNETVFEKVLWYRVRAFDEDSTEGWLEAQHVIKEEALEKSKALAEEAKDLQSQAVGQLRAPSNLRLTPEQKDDSNILLKLENRATFEIVDWEYVKKEAGPETTESEEIQAAKEGSEEDDKINDIYDIWYKVRLDPSVSPAPMGWIFGRQVDPQVPGDIIYYQTNKRKFVTWLSLEDEGAPKQVVSPENGEVKVTKPGSWVILSRTNEVKAIDGVEPDFDGILVLGFDKYNEEHYTTYSTERERIDVWGMLPLKVEGSGDNKSFIVNLRNPQTGKMEEKRFLVTRDKNKRLRVTPPEGLETEKQGKK